MDKDERVAFVVQCTWDSELEAICMNASFVMQLVTRNYEQKLFLVLGITFTKVP